MIDISKNNLFFYELENKFPEKTNCLGKVFRSTTTSYKYVWFLSILSLIKQSDLLEIKLKDIFMEMVKLAWHPVCLYRLSLGKLDKLQEIVTKIQAKTNLPLDADYITLGKIIKTQYHDELKFLSKYVPTRFLSPWFTNGVEGVKSHQKDSLIKSFARESQNTIFPTLYYFNDTSTAIILNKSWRNFLLNNLGIIQSFVEYHFALYLQARNPNVPGIICKLHAPTQRNLQTARKIWGFIRKEFINSGRGHMFKDIYSEKIMNADFSIDHFIPWSFVIHDLLWNLIPVEKSTNSKKSDRLPDLDIYLPRLVKLHYNAIKMLMAKPRFLEDYILCFKEEPRQLLSLGEEGLKERYYKIMSPLAQIAINQGFQSNWSYQDEAV